MNFWSCRKHNFIENGAEHSPRKWWGSDPCWREVNIKLTNSWKKYFWYPTCSLIINVLQHSSFLRQCHHGVFRPGIDCKSFIIVLFLIFSASTQFQEHLETFKVLYALKYYSCFEFFPFQHCRIYSSSRAIQQELLWSYGALMVLWCSMMFYVLRAFLVSFCRSVPPKFLRLFLHWLWWKQIMAQHSYCKDQLLKPTIDQQQKALWNKDGAEFKGSKQGRLYLTTHRMIFNNKKTDVSWKKLNSKLFDHTFFSG